MSRNPPRKGHFRIVSWNINSVRARLESIEKFLKDYDPDVLCLQEIKATEDVFPLRFFEDLGFKHTAIRGQKSYHGVATLARCPLSEIQSRDWCGKGDARHVSVRLPMGSVLHNFYVPAGGDIPDPKTNDKFEHKLAFLDEMIAWSKKLRQPSILVGDLNVAPTEWDVWSHKALLKVVSHTPIETNLISELQQAHNWVDAVRHKKPEPEKLYSWWSYRARDWAESNRGRRLDHIWVSPELGPAIQNVEIATRVRGWEKPSDHAPVILDIKLS